MSCRYPHDHGATRSTIWYTAVTPIAKEPLGGEHHQFKYAVHLAEEGRYGHS